MPADPARNLVLAIVAQNENRILETESQSLGACLSVLGYQHSVIDMFQPSGAHQLTTHLSENRVAFAYGFAGVGSQLNFNNGANIWTRSRTPFVGLWYDHPAYNYRQHIVDSPYVGHLYHIADHLAAREKHLPKASSIYRLATLAHGVAPPGQRRLMRERQRKIIFVKTGHNPAMIAEGWRRHPQALQDIFWQAVEQALKNDQADLGAIVGELLLHNGKSLDNLDLFMGVVAEIDGYVRSWRSDRLARALLPHPAVIIGRGWDYLRAQAATASFLPPMDFGVFLNTLQDYRIAANSSPLWADGLHERVSCALHYGLVTLTDRSRLSDSMLQGVPNYVPFSWQDDLQDKIAESFHLADDLDADYYTPAAHRFWQWLPNAEYIVQLENFVEAIRQHAEGKV